MPLAAPHFWLFFFSLAGLVASDHSQLGSSFHSKHRRHSHNTNASRRTHLSRQQESTRTFTLVDRYQGESFFDNWDFFSYNDPTHGLVEYVEAPTAFSEGLAYVGEDGVAVMTVDTKTSLSVGQNRKSVRITSKKTYNGGLFILDVQSMPHGPAVWPAFWMCGPNWPFGGEIDIIEGVHDQAFNQYTLHTAPGCTIDTSKSLSSLAPSLLSAMDPSKIFTGSLLATECDAAVNYNAGCGILDTDGRSYGAGLNAEGGGVFATLWDGEGIRIWFFLHSSVPSDILAETPDPSTWPSPKAFWASSSCPTNAFFNSLSMIFDITLCGDWAGATYNSAGYSGTCAERVADPANFETANWRIRSIKVYN